MEEKKNQNPGTSPGDSLIKGSLKVSPPHNLPLVIKDLSDLKAAIAESTPPSTETPEKEMDPETGEEVLAPIIKKSFLADSQTDHSNQDTAIKSDSSLDLKVENKEETKDNETSNVLTAKETEGNQPIEKAAIKTEPIIQLKSLEKNPTPDNTRSENNDPLSTGIVVNKPSAEIEPESLLKTSSTTKSNPPINSSEVKKAEPVKILAGLPFLGTKKPIDLDLDNLPIINDPLSDDGKNQIADNRKMKGFFIVLISFVFFLLVIAVIWYYKGSIDPLFKQKNILSSPENTPLDPASTEKDTPSTTNGSGSTLPGQEQEPEIVPDFSGQFQLNLAQNKETLVLKNGENNLSLKIKELGLKFNFDYPVQIALFTQGTEMTLEQLKKALGLIIPASIDNNGQKKFAFLLAKESGVVKSVLVIETASSPESNKAALLEWEKTMVGDLDILKLGETAQDPANPEDFRFRDSVSLPNSRYINLSQSKKITLEYTILADKILISTSETVMVKIFELK